MRSIAFAVLAAILITIASNNTASAVTFAGVEFERNAFATRVVKVSMGKVRPTNARARDSRDVLGEPDYRFSTDTGAYSLGFRGSITVELEDTFLAGDGSSNPDLAVFEVVNPEPVKVSISRDGRRFYDVGTISSSDPFIDIDGAIKDKFPKLSDRQSFSFVRLEDVGPLGSSATAGADVDAIGAVHTRRKSDFVIEGSQGASLLSSLLDLRDLGGQDRVDAINLVQECASAIRPGPECDGVELSRSGDLYAGLLRDAEEQVFQIVVDNGPIISGPSNGVELAIESPGFFRSLFQDGAEIIGLLKEGGRNAQELQDQIDSGELKVQGFQGGFGGFNINPYFDYINYDFSIELAGDWSFLDGESSLVRDTFLGNDFALGLLLITDAAFGSDGKTRLQTTWRHIETSQFQAPFSAVPLPSSFWTLGVAVIFMLKLRRRRSLLTI